MTLSDQPAVTFALFSYNQERFIAEAVHGALSQAYSPLEIIISDDCSSDTTFEIINSIISSYDGDHRVIVRKNESNLGVLGHINQVMQVSSGDLIIVAAGDDVSLPHRVDRIVDVWKKEKAFIIWSNAIIIDQNGTQFGPFYTKALPHITTFSDTLAGRSLVAGAMCAWRRDVFDVFGPLSGDAINEDVMIPFRGALLGKVCYVDEVLVLYRKHGDNLSFFMKLPSSSISRLMDLNIRNQKNTLMNCIELKELLKRAETAGISDIDYESSNFILDRQIMLLNIEIDLLSRNLWKRLALILNTRGILLGSRKFLKFLLIAFSPPFFVLLFKYRFLLKNGARW